MAVDLLLGLQWGDEGKGKSLMFLPQIMILLLVFKGPNAGHTLEFDGINMYLEPFLLEFFIKQL
jgi:adenylosuccinate synthase